MNKKFLSFCIAILVLHSCSGAQVTFDEKDNVSDVVKKLAALLLAMGLDYYIPEGLAQIVPYVEKAMPVHNTNIYSLLESLKNNHPNIMLAFAAFIKLAAIKCNQEGNYALSVASGNPPEYVLPDYITLANNASEIWHAEFPIFAKPVNVHNNALDADIYSIKGRTLLCYGVNMKTLAFILTYVASRTCPSLKQLGIEEHKLLLDAYLLPSKPYYHRIILKDSACESPSYTMKEKLQTGFYDYAIIGGLKFLLNKMSIALTNLVPAPLKPQPQLHSRVRFNNDGTATIMYEYQKTQH